MVTPTYDFLVEAEAKRSFAGSFFAYFFLEKSRLFLVQLKDGHEGLGGHLHSAQTAHFLLACSPAEPSAGGPKGD